MTAPGATTPCGRPSWTAVVQDVLVVSALVALATAVFLVLDQERATPASSAQTWAVIVHVVAGLGVLTLLPVFLFGHVRRSRQRPAAAATGVVVVLLAGGAAATGFWSADRTSAVDDTLALRLHGLVGFAVPVAYVLHLRVSTFRSRRALRRPAVCAAVAAATLAAFSVAHFLTPRPVQEAAQVYVDRTAFDHDPWHGGQDPHVDGPFAPSRTSTRSGGPAAASLFGLGVPASGAAAACGRCHADIAADWSESAHRFASFNNPFYARAVDVLRDQPDGRRRSQACAGCHDPVLLLTGAMQGHVDRASDAAVAGIGCAVCHRIDRITGVHGNASYRFDDVTGDAYPFAGATSEFGVWLHDLTVNAFPGRHKRSMMKPVLGSPESCGACHKLSLDASVNGWGWVRGQNDYDDYLASPFAGQRAAAFYEASPRRCQDCHMQAEPVRRGDAAARRGQVLTHRFPGGNTALPAVRGTAFADTVASFLRDGSIRVTVFGVRREDGSVFAARGEGDVVLQPGETVEIQVVVRNVGVGHSFPGGTQDSNEAWLEVEARSSGGGAWSSGVLAGPRAELDRDAHVYGEARADERGDLCSTRNSHEFRVTAFRNVIRSGESDLVRYRLRIPVGEAEGRLSVRAALKWRKFSPEFTAFAFGAGGAAPVLPVTEVACDEVMFGIGRPSVGGAAPTDVRTAPPPPWEDWNDWAVGSLLRGDWDSAETGFRAVRERAPDREDGWRNLARTHLARRRPAAALEVLREAAARGIASARTAYFEAAAYAASDEFGAALEKFTTAARRYPRDPEIRRATADVLLRLGRPGEALQQWLRALAVDPEDPASHAGRAAAYRALGDERAAGEADAVAARHRRPAADDARVTLLLTRRADLAREARADHAHHLRVR